MKRVVFIAMTLLSAGHALAQVDVESRRTLTIQSSAAVYHGEERVFPFGYFWFNENNYPWTNTALRVICAGIYVDAELSWFLPANTNVAIGAGAGGGLYLSSVTPYRQGERISSGEFYGDDGGGRVFINETIPNPTPLPLNVRATYGTLGTFYRKADDTLDFTLPPDFVTQTLQAELRFGGIEPGLLARRGAELYLEADANFRSGFAGFGPNGGLFPAHSQYDRFFGSLAGKIPVGPTAVALRVSGGRGEQLDELSAWKLGGNMVGIDPYAYTIHGYYTREIFVEDFVLSNLAFSFPIMDRQHLAGHLYGDYAAAKPFDVTTGQVDEWHSFFGVGAGMSFRALWKTDWLASYGYGVNALRNGQHGGHELGLALEKRF